MEKENKSKKLIQTGIETFGAVVGGAISLIDGPTGTFGGGIAGVIISKGLSELADRFLSNREQARVGVAAGLSITGIQQNIDNGLTPRDDDFFDSNGINRSKAEELFEGILIKCKNEFEEKKIAYISNIYKNVAFNSFINPDNANQILNSVEQFSYRQLAILALIGQNTENNFFLRENDSRDNNTTISTEVEFLLQDYILLDKQGIIVRNDNTAVLDTSDVVPGLMKLTSIGFTYFELLDLNTMPKEEFYFLEQLK